MIKPSFDIVPENFDATDFHKASLFMEISGSSFTYFFLDRDAMRLMALRHFSIEHKVGKSLSEAIAEIISSEFLLKENIHEATVVYNYPESDLVPSQYYDISINKPLSELMHGDVLKGLALSEKIQGWDMYNIYRVPRDIHQLIQKQFAAGKYWHYYTLLLSGNQNARSIESGMLKLIFYTDRFILAVFNNEKLQLLNTFTYQTPEDVAYYALATVQHLALDPNTILLEISGLIEEDSALYTELYKFFQHLSFEKTSEEIETIGLLENYPAHYFSPFLNLALCV